MKRTEKQAREDRRAEIVEQRSQDYEARTVRARDDMRYRALRYEETNLPHPWRVFDQNEHANRIPSRRTKSRYRTIAEELAKLRTGAEHACYLCFRPLEKYRELKIKAVEGGRPFYWKLCPDCVAGLIQLLNRMMVMPPWREMEPAWPSDEGSDA